MSELPMLSHHVPYYPLNMENAEPPSLPYSAYRPFSAFRAPVSLPPHSFPCADFNWICGCTAPS